jgi:hypothetical protein
VFFPELHDKKAKGERIMKKGLLLLLAGLMAFFGVSAKVLADTRLDSLGASVQEVEDLDLIWLYPNKVLEYKDTADFRLNTAGLGSGYGAGVGEWGGIIKDMNDQGLGILGVYVNRPLAMVDVASTGFTAGVGPALLLGRYWSAVAGPLASGATPGNNLDLLWGTDLSGASLGIHLGYGDSYSLATSEILALHLGAGLGFANVGSFSQGNIYAQYDNLGGAPGGSFSDIKAGTLWQNDINENSDMRYSLDLESDSAPGSASGLAAELGLSCNHKVNSGKGLLSSGLFLDYDSASNFGGVKNDNYSAWSWVWNGNVEAQALDWLTVRAGLTKTLYNRTNHPFVANDALGGAAFTTGVGVNWQNWTLDGKVSATSLENSIANVAPGNGIFMTDATNPNAGNIITITEADLRYKF